MHPRQLCFSLKLLHNLIEIAVLKISQASSDGHVACCDIFPFVWLFHLWPEVWINPYVSYHFERTTVRRWWFSGFSIRFVGWFLRCCYWRSPIAGSHRSRSLLGRSCTLYSSLRGGRTFISQCRSLAFSLRCMVLARWAACPDEYLSMLRYRLVGCAYGSLARAGSFVCLG